MLALKRTLYELNLDKINLIVFIVGILMVSSGFFLKNDLKTIVISVGTSIIASSIIAFLTARYLVRKSKVKEIMEKWGLEGIYETRSEMNTSSNFHLDKIEKEMDIMALGIRNFRHAKGNLIKEKVKKNITIRILTLNPHSDFVSQREKDEDTACGEIKKTILDMIDWVNELKEVAPCKENVQLKFYDTYPLDSYLRIDGQVYVGLNMYNKVSQQSISFEFKKNALGYKYFHNYFEKLWNDNNFCKETLS